MIIVPDDDSYKTSLTDEGSQFEDDDANLGSALADPIDDDRSRYEQVISELTEFENSQFET
jgi:hypothetical protein